MNRRYIAAVVALTGVLGASVVAVSQGESQDPVATAGPAAPPDSAPASGPAVVARTSAAGGGELGVATYRNSAGNLCAAFGRMGAAGLVDRRGRGAPFKEVGDCTMRPVPVAVQVTSQADDPTTKGDDRSVIIWGLAANDVNGIDISVGNQRQTSRPGRDGAFVASMPPTPGNVLLTLHRSDGSEQKLTLPPAPDIDGLNAQLKAGEIPRHKEGGP